MVKAFKVRLCYHLIIVDLNHWHHSKHNWLRTTFILCKITTLLLISIWLTAFKIWISSGAYTMVIPWQISARIKKKIIQSTCYSDDSWNKRTKVNTVKKYSLGRNSLVARQLDKKEKVTSPTANIMPCILSKESTSMHIYNIIM